MGFECVFGPPGCGKTTHLRTLIKDLVDEGTGLSEITFVTHTNAAANEMLLRLQLPRSDKVCTLHALCFRLLGLSHLSVIGGKHLRVFEQLVNVPITGKKSDDDGQELGDMYLDIISFARNKVIPLEQAYYQSDRPGTYVQFAYFAETYDEWRRVQYLIDYTDMLERFLATPKLDHSIVLVIDETQDLSNLQWAVVHKMIEMNQYERVVIVGDDDQSLYSWGGADPDGMNNFCTKYSADTLVLAQSYRVPIVVHRVSQALIRRVEKRMDKPYWPRNDEGIMHHFGEIQDILDVDPPIEDTLVIARTHSIVHELEREMIYSGIPYIKEGGRPGMFENRYATAIRAFNKLQSGVMPSKLAMNAFNKVCWTQYCDGFGVAGKTYQDVMDVPPMFIHYYNRVDIDVEPKTRLSTIHSSKGKEASRVILSTELTPRIMENMAKSEDDEIRVFYVGMTRAKKRLDILGSGFQLIQEVIQNG